MQLAVLSAVGCAPGDRAVGVERFLGMTIIEELYSDETGATLAEYAMLLAMMAVATVGAVTALRNQIIAVFDQAGDGAGAV